MNYNRKRKSLYFLTLFLILIGACSAPAAALPPINMDESGAAIHGYDTVAYFTDGKPTLGSREFSHEWNGAKWLFSSREHLESFKADPERYAPQFGGY